MPKHPFFGNDEAYAQYCMDRITTTEIIELYRELKGLEPHDDVPPLDLMHDAVEEYFMGRYYT